MTKMSREEYEAARLPEDLRKLEALKASEIKQVNDDAEVPAELKAQLIAIINTATVADLDRSMELNGRAFNDRFSAQLIALYEAHGL